MLKRAAALTAAGACAASLASCGAGDFLSGDFLSGSEYVAIGDSFASVGSASVLDQSTEEADYCLRSFDNYPHLVAKKLGMKLADVSCQGAIAAEILSGFEYDQHLIPAQADALSTKTKLVTLTIGANNVAFGDLSGCGPDPNNPDSDEHPSTLDSKCLNDARTTNDRALSFLPTRLDEIYRGIKALAPNAKIVTTSYLPVILATDRCDYAQQLDPAELQWFEDTTVELNRIVKAAATSHGAIFVEPADVFAHTACASPSERWTSTDGTETDSFPMHPTKEGHAAMAAAIVAALQGS